MEENTVVEKLKVALGLVETLKQENQVYKDNFDHLKLTLNSLTEKHAALSKEYEVTAREKHAIEQHASDASLKLKGKLDEKTREIEILKQKVKSPKDLEIIRLKNLEEFDLGSKKTWRALDQEIEKYRGSYYKLRKEHDILLSETSRLHFDAKSKIEILHSTHHEELSHMETKLSALQTSLDAVSDTERMRNLARQNNELQLKVVGMLAELQQVRTERESSRVDFEQQERLHKRTLLEEVANARHFCADRDALQTRVNCLANETRDLVSSNERLGEENQRETREAANLRIQLEEAVHCYAIESSDLKLAFIKEKTDLSNTTEDLKKRLGEVKGALKSSVDQARDLKGRLSMCDREYIDKLRVVREEEWSKISKTDAEKQELERQVSQLKQSQQDSDHREECFKRESNAEICKLRRHLTSLVSEHDGMTSQNQMLVSERERTLLQLDQVQSKVSEFEHSNASLSRDLEGKGRAEQAQLEKVVSLETSVVALRAEIAASDENAQREIRAYKHNNDRQLSTLTNEKSNIMASFSTVQVENQGLVDRLGELEDALEKQQSTYKSKLAHVKAKAKEFKSEAATLKVSLYSETQKAADRTREARIRETDFLSLLQHENL